MPNSTAAAPTSDWEKYGIPPRQPSMALWSHLLGKDKLPAPPNSDVIPPPIAPMDKNGTSMRILLHDTQAHLERFSVRADKLFSSVEETKREITTVNTLFQREHEALRDDVVDLVNRSQTELQKAIGNPAQTPTLERLTKDVDRRLEALDKRVDAIQALNQSQGQTLQIQSQTLHTIQDQLGTIIAALMPLLPLLQAIPLHIESARNTLNDTIAKSSKTPMHTSTYLRPARSISSARTRRGKRSSSTLHSDGASSPSPHPNKRPRVSEAPQISDQPFNHTEEASDVRETLPQAGQRPIPPDPPQDPTQTTSSLPISAATAPSSLKRQNSNVMAANIKTPRRPLAELFPKTQIQTEVPSLTQISTSRSINTSSRLHLRPSSPPHASSSPQLLRIAPSAQRPPRLLRVNSSISEVVGVHAPAPAEAAPKQGFIDDTRRAVEISRLKSKVGVEPPNQPSTSGLSLAPSASSRPIVTTRASFAPTAEPRSFPSHRPGIPLLPPLPQPHQPLTTQESRLTRSSMNPIPMSSMGSSERRSPFREGRRFIPLQDSEDEDELE